MPRKKAKSRSESESKVRKPELAIWPISRLQAHPLQDRSFRPLAPREFDALVENIRKRGIDHPPDVLPKNAAGLPSGSIVAGHQRWGAAQELGWKKITVRIRHDLAHKSAAEIEEVLIADNLFRRQLSRLDRARSICRLYEIALGRSAGDLCDSEKIEIRNSIAQQFDCSPKTITRDLDILTTPAEIQAAYDAEALNVEDAVKVAHLAADMQEEIAARIRAGEPPSELVKEYVRRKPVTSVQKSPLVTVNKRLKEIKELVPDDFDGIAAECPFLFATDMLTRINELQPVMLKLTDALQRAKDRVDASFEQLAIARNCP